MKKSIFLRKLARFAIFWLRRIKSGFFTLGIKTDEKTVMFCSFNGKSYSCNPRAVYEYMQKEDKFKNYNFIWAFKEPEKYNFLKCNFNTDVVKFNTAGYYKALARSKYWIFNYRVLDHIYPKKDQVYVQCWHGTPLKRLGYDLKNTFNVMNSTEEIYQKYKTDAQKFSYLLSPSGFATEKFISAWDLKNIKKQDCIVETGYPRNDFLYRYTEKNVIDIKKNLGIDNDKKVILYAPTWRDNQHDSSTGYIYKNEVDFDYLKSRLEEEYIILFRAHYLVSNTFDFSKYKGFVYDVSAVDDINELYIVSDLLVTDYSSVFFDYANLKRPILFFMYDLDFYKDELRGFYISTDELPGPIVTTVQELAEKIKTVSDDFSYDRLYGEFNKKYNYLEDGNSSKRLTKECIL